MIPPDGENQSLSPTRSEDNRSTSTIQPDNYTTDSTPSLHQNNTVTAISPTISEEGVQTHSHNLYSDETLPELETSHSIHLTDIDIRFGDTAPA